jgi:hypothetical protein
MSQTLQVKLNDDLLLDIGRLTVRKNAEEHRIEYHIAPPSISLFDQVTDYLWKQPEPPYRGLHNRDLGIGFAALTMRWGSYLAALCAAEYPVYEPDVASISAAHNRSVSLISDEEMRRLNIEISANIAQLGLLFNNDSMRFYNLLLRAFAYLPMPIRSAKPNHRLRQGFSGEIVAGSLNVYLARHPHMSQKVLTSLGLDADGAEDYYANYTLRQIPGEPARVIANFLTKAAWRNTMIEDYHAGLLLNRDAPLLPEQRRLNVKEQRELMRELSDNSYEVINTFYSFYSSERFSRDPRFDFVPIYPQIAEAICNMGFSLYSYPSAWSTTERSADVVLRHYPQTATSLLS